MISRKNETAPSHWRPFNETGLRRITGWKNRNLTLSRITTWNIGTLYKAGKLTTVALEMRRVGIEVRGLSGVRWPNAVHCIHDDVVLYYSGCQNGKT